MKVFLLFSTAPGLDQKWSTAAGLAQGEGFIKLWPGSCANISNQHTASPSPASTASAVPQNAS